MPGQEETLAVPPCLTKIVRFAHTFYMPTLLTECLLGLTYLPSRCSACPRKSIHRRARTAFPPPAALCDRAIDRYYSLSTVFMSISQFVPFVKNFIKILWLCAHIILYIPKHTTSSPLTNKEKCGSIDLHRNSRR